MGRKAVHLNPAGDKAGRLPKSIVNTTNRIFTLFIACFVTGSLLAPPVPAQDSLYSGSVSLTSAEDQLYALALTRFHFLTLKQFHSALFSFGQDQNPISESEARLLNIGLNAFLASTGRETLLLDALRENKAVQLRFSVPEEKTVLRLPFYEAEPTAPSIPASIEIKPLLDRPVAFQISLEKEGGRNSYNVDWAGKITRLS
jgi:hypothetical protein